MRRILAIAFGLTMLAAPVAANHVDWRPAPESRYAAFTAALVPVHTDLLANIEDMKAVSQRIGALHTFPEDAALMREVWLTFQDIARAGLLVTDAYIPEPCFGDFWAAERLGFLLLGESTAAFPYGGGYFTQSMGLIGPGGYADLLASKTTCDPASTAGA